MIIKYEDLLRFDFAHTEAKKKLRNLDHIDTFVPHHTGDNVDDFDRHARYHVSKGWRTLGYHLVRHKGKLGVAREIHEVGSHVKNNNATTIGGCIAGNFNKTAPTPQQYWDWIQMQLICEQYLGRKLKTALHCQFRPTTCPGKLFNIEYYLEHLNDFRLLINP